MSEFPDYFTIDELGLDSLCYFLKQEFEGKTVLIKVEEESYEHYAENNTLLSR